MYGLDNNSGISVMPDIAPATSPVPLWFTEGGANQSPSWPGQDWHNMMQGELLNVVTESGLTPNKANNKQVAAAIRAMIANSANVVPVGVPLPWPTSVAPSGWLKCNGASFDKAKYPLLAAAYPSGTLPDLRGEFIRGWDDGRGLDPSRALLTEQSDAIRQMTGSVANVWTSDPTMMSGVLSYGGTGAQALMAGTGIAIQFRNVTFNASAQVPTAAENRPKNVAFNYIVRAA